MEKRKISLAGNRTPAFQPLARRHLAWSCFVRVWVRDLMYVCLDLICSSQRKDRHSLLSNFLARHAFQPVMSMIWGFTA
jgi:hypothetical protein